MTKDDFALLFEEAVRQALAASDISPAAEPLVRFVGKPNPTDLITVRRALDLLWLSGERFYEIVDVGALVGEEDPAVLFVRLSGHPPVPFSDTYDPAYLGPFKVIGPVGRPAA